MEVDLRQNRNCKTDIFFVLVCSTKVCGLQAKGVEQVCKCRVMLARLMLKRARIYAFYALCFLIDLRKKNCEKNWQFCSQDQTCP